MINTFTAEDMKDYGDYVATLDSAMLSPNFEKWCKERFEPTKKVIDQKLVDARASYEAARAIDLVKYGAALDASLIDSLFTTYKETMSELQITGLINDTWQVEDDEMVWYQGSLEDCQAYLKEQDK